MVHVSHTSCCNTLQTMSGALGSFGLVWPSARSIVPYWEGPGTRAAPWRALPIQDEASRMLQHTSSGCSLFILSISERQTISIEQTSGPYRALFLVRCCNLACPPLMCHIVMLSFGVRVHWVGGSTPLEKQAKLLGTHCDQHFKWRPNKTCFSIPESWHSDIRPAPSDGLVNIVRTRPRPWCGAVRQTDTYRPRLERLLGPGIPTTGDYLDPVEGPGTVLVSEKMPCHRQSLAQINEERWGNCRWNKSGRSTN